MSIHRLVFRDQSLHSHSFHSSLILETINEIFVYGKTKYNHQYIDSRNNPYIFTVRITASLGLMHESY